MTLGLRVVNVEMVEVAVPSSPVAATVRVYAVDGRRRSVAVQVPSESAFPGTVSPLASTRVTAPTVPEDALTVTGALGRTPAARSAGVISSTAGVGSGAGVVVVGAACPALAPGSFPVWPPAASTWQALSRTLSATSATATPWTRWNLIDVATTSTDSQVTASGRWFTAPP